MFKNNIKALKLSNPNLAEKLEKISIEETSSEIAVYEAESSDLIIAYKEVPLDSVYDPIRESKTIWNRAINYEAKKNDIQIIFGLGLGYLFKRAYINADSRICVYEPYLNVLRFVFEYIDLSAEISNERVYITDSQNECVDFALKKYLAGDKIEVLYQNAYANVANKELFDLTANLLNGCEQRNFDSNTIKFISKLRTLNFVKNIKHYPKCKPFTRLEGKLQGKTALIVSAGPSLLDDIQSIKESREKFVIIAVGRALRTLLKYNIRPDFTVFMDVMDATAILKDLNEEIKELNLILDACTCKSVYEQEAKSKFIYYTKLNPLMNLFEKASAKTLKKYDSAGTVSMVSYYIAKALGCVNFIFSGLDLAFTNNRMYSESEEFKLTENGRMCGANNTDNIYIEADGTIWGTRTPKSTKVQVMGINGEMIDTRADYALFIRQFEEEFTQNPSENIYNTSSGAKIKGMKYIKLPELISQIDNLNSDINKTIGESFSCNTEEWEVFCKNLSNLLTNQITTMTELTEKTKPIIDEIKAVLKIIVEKQAITANEEESLKTLVQSSTTLIAEMTSNELLSNYLQSELLEYIKLNQSYTFSTFENFIKKLEFDISLLEQAVSCENQIKLI